ncbi:MAG: MiaB/RimO family radical SAM methylthiotransferase [Phycisphaerales bacterium]
MTKRTAQRDAHEVRTVSFVSLGCPKNLVDSEKMLGLLAESGLVPVSYTGREMDEHGVERVRDEETERRRDVGGDDFGGADAVVINTCGFLEASKDESLSVIREAVKAKRAGTVKRVVVAGCLVQRHRAKMLEWEPGIDAMVGVFDRDRIVEAVSGGSAVRSNGGTPGAAGAPRYWIAGNALNAAKERGRDTVGLTVHGKDGKGIGYFEDDSARLRLTPRHYAYLRISEGCNQNCTFCTIPGIRGKMRSKPADRVGAEARELMLDGAFELNLIGQDTTSWGDDIGAGLGGGRDGETQRRRDGETGGLPMLLRTVTDAVKSTTGAGWVRLMYAYPSNFSDPIIDAFAAQCARGHLLPYIDMPLQHASDRILASMRRNVTSEHQRGLIRKLRERVPGIAVRTTFISGFPGENEDDHKRLLEFVEESAFEAMGVFEYSREDNTPAGTMEGDPALVVPAGVKARRRAELMELQQRIAFRRAADLAGKFDAARPTKSGERFDVLIDAPTRTAGKATTGVGRGGTLYAGRTYFQAPMIDAVTYVQSREKLAPGELVRCVIVGSDGYDLTAKPVSEVESKVTLKVL